MKASRSGAASVVAQRNAQHSPTRRCPSSRRRPLRATSNRATSSSSSSGATSSSSSSSNSSSSLYWPEGRGAEAPDNQRKACWPPTWPTSRTSQALNHLEVVNSASREQRSLASARSAIGPAASRPSSRSLGRKAASPLGRMTVRSLGRNAASPLGRMTVRSLGREAAGPIGRVTMRQPRGRARGARRCHGHAWVEHPTIASRWPRWALVHPELSVSNGPRRHVHVLSGRGARALVPHPGEPSRYERRRGRSRRSTRTTDLPRLGRPRRRPRQPLLTTGAAARHCP